MRHIAPQKKFWTTVVLVSAVPLAIGLAIGVPYTLMWLGLTRQYGWSFLRVGHKELNRQVDYTGGRFRPKPLSSGPIYVLDGEKLVLDYHIIPTKDSKGSLDLRVRKLFSSNVVWRRSFDKSSNGRATVPLGPGHFFTELYPIKSL
jgi:hypothetical protein